MKELGVWEVHRCRQCGDSTYHQLIEVDHEDECITKWTEFFELWQCEVCHGVA